MKQLQFPILTYIDVTVKAFDITTTALIDTGYKITFFQDFYYQNGKNYHLIEKFELKAFIPHLYIFRTCTTQCVYYSQK